MKKLFLLAFSLLILNGCCQVLNIPFLCDNSGPPPTTPPPQSNPVCGNGQVEFQEQCDDGNTSSGDGCSSSCQNENPVDAINPVADGNPLTQQEICENTQDATQRDNCWVDLAVVTGDGTYCQNLSDRNGKDYCWDQVARTVPDNSLCDNILSQPVRESCQLATTSTEVSLPAPGEVSIGPSERTENPGNILIDAQYALMTLAGPMNCLYDEFSPQGYFCKHEDGYFIGGYTTVLYGTPQSGKILIEAGSFDENCSDPNHAVCDTSGGVNVLVTDNYRGISNTDWTIAIGNWQVAGDNTVHSFMSKEAHDFSALLISRGPGGPGRSDVRIYSVSTE